MRGLPPRTPASGHLPFDRDVSSHGSYAYTGPNSQLSSFLANRRQSDLIRSALRGDEQSLIDIGCGDGTYSYEFLEVEGLSILGVDPSAHAIAAAVANQGTSKRISFVHGSIDDIDGIFDLAVLRGVLHHAENPQELLHLAAQKARRLIVLEPNGLNPILKAIEKLSPYHRHHQERSFNPKRLRSWITEAGFEIEVSKVGGLVPFFAPDWMAKLLERLRPSVESLPIARSLLCGSRLYTARSSVHGRLP